MCLEVRYEKNSAIKHLNPLTNLRRSVCEVSMNSVRSINKTCAKCRSTPCVPKGPNACEMTKQFDKASKMSFGYEWCVKARTKSRIALRSCRSVIPSKTSLSATFSMLPQKVTWRRWSIPSSACQPSPTNVLAGTNTTTPGSRSNRLPMALPRSTIAMF